MFRMKQESVQSYSFDGTSRAEWLSAAVDWAFLITVVLENDVERYSKNVFELPYGVSFRDIAVRYNLKVLHRAVSWCKNVVIK